MGELLEGEITVDGRVRTFAVRPPRDTGAPLVLALHGNQSGSTGGRTPGEEPMMYAWTSFAEHADEWGVAVAYPDGWNGCWADGRGVTLADEAGVDDVAFLRALIEWCSDRFGTTPEFTVPAGISNGAFMSHYLALRASELVPVFGAVAGGFTVAHGDERPTHAVSALLINGDADPTVPITGGFSRHLGPNGELRGQTWGLTESAGYWIAVDGCTGETVLTTAGSQRITSSGGVGGTEVAAWTAFGAGHTWPGTPIPEEWANFPGATVTMEFDAAEEIWRFAAPLLLPPTTRKL